ncbi:unnamed protein product [Caenorhabditis auriculariae]|uniref:Transmembrane protein n=1 Tax=Caenorhabditis auriculariae TaxID=2777116 RepID=A0A8S1HSV2_9PELO|nr:unnamed protein product [Caenorhabditis auriculariae]
MPFDAQEDERVDVASSSFTNGNLDVFKQAAIWCEAVFAIFFAVTGFYEYQVGSRPGIAYLMALSCFLLILLSVQFHFGFKYNCAALLYCHTAQASTLAVICLVAVLGPHLMSETFASATDSLRHSLVCYTAYVMCVAALLITFATASHTRMKDLRSLETSRVEHLKRLISSGMEHMPEVERENREGKIRPLNVFSLS